jgi:UDP-2,4-diacetamido-2,4,6-trideoxy-beta-L-altropyranose hydrolase
MSKIQVIIRVNDGNDTGLGHLYRGIALAETLQDKFDILFVIKSNFAYSILQTYNYNYLLIENLQLKDEPLWFKENFDIKKNIIVCDGYIFDENYQKAIKKQNFTLVYIDDMVKEYIYADLLINHSPGINQSDYKAEIYTDFALGLDYALIRSEFIDYELNDNNKFENVFVSFGGYDSNDFTFQVVQQLLQIPQIKKINVLLGKAYNHSKINKISSNKLNIFRDLNSKEILDVVNDSHCAIVSASTIAIELTFTGLPILLGYYIDNQINIYKGLIQETNSFPLDNFNFFNFNELKSIFKKFSNQQFNSQHKMKRNPHKNIRNKFIKLINKSIKN